MIEFAENMMIGIEHIDAQHREMVNFLNKSLELCKSSPGKEEIESGLDFLAYYISTHFHDEEKLQIECNYPLYNEHKAIHEDFTKSFVELKSIYMSGNITLDELARKLAQTVLIWVLKHIQEKDIEFGEYYNQVQNIKKQDN